MANNIEPVVMPKLGLSMTEGMVAKWHVSSGDRVQRGDIIADIETSKITNELEVHRDGVIRGELASEGVDLPVGALLCVITDESVTDKEIDDFISSFRISDSSEKEAAAEQSNVTESMSLQEAGPADNDIRAESEVTVDSSKQITDIPESLTTGDDDTNVHASHLARKLAGHLGINLNNIPGTGRHGRVSKRDIKAAIEAAGASLGDGSTAVSKKTDENLRATPLAKRLAEKHQVSLSDVTPSGHRGRITKDDVRRVVEVGEEKPVVKEEPAAPRGPEQEWEEYPLSSIRKIIGERLTRSKQEAPHFRLTMELKLDQLLQLRKEINSNLDDGARVSINDMLVKAVAHSLKRNPDVNIQFDGSQIRRYKNADVAVAVALDEGLITPVVRKADDKSIGQISREIADMTERARKGTLQPEEFEGGTFTLSNLGMFGIKSFDAIINPPQAAILAVGTLEKKRIFAGDNEVIATTMTANLSCDHRVIDGAMGARFLNSFRQAVEHPGIMLT